MKLPQVTYRPVESLGRANLGAVGAETAAIQQQGQAYQRAMGAIAEVSADYIERQENAEYNEQVAEYQIELSNWQAAHNAKQFYKADEIGEGIDENTVPRVVTSTDDNGVQVSEFRDSIPAYEVYPHLLKQKLEGMIKDKSGKISNPNLRNAFLEKAGADAATLMMRATVAAEQAQQAYQLDVGVEKARDAAESGNLAMAQFLIDNLETDDLAKKRLSEEAEGLVEVYEVTQAIRSTDPDTVMTLRSLLADENYSGSLTEAQRQAAIRDLDQRYEYLTREQDAELAKAHETFISDAYFGIEQGTFTLRDVEEYYERWQQNDTDPRSVSGRERTALRNAINSRNARMKAHKDLVGIGESVINNGGNPQNPDHRKGVDAFVADKQITDPRKLEEIAIRSNIMPQPMRDFLTVAALHDAEQGGEKIAIAVESYGRLSDMKPEVIPQIGKESRDILGDTHIFVRGGMDVVDAYKTAREISQLKPELREGREKAYRDGDFADSNVGVLDQLMDDDDTMFGFETTFWNQSEVPPNLNMQIAFDTATRMHYILGRDIDLARKRAWNDMRQTWGPSQVGSVLTNDGLEPNKWVAMEYPPERVMAVTPEVANQRLEAFARAEGLEAENLTVMSDDRTARDGSWAIMVTNPETDETRFHPRRWIGIDWAEEAAQHTWNEAAKAARENEQAESLSKQRSSIRGGQ